MRFLIPIATGSHVILNKYYSFTTIEGYMYRYSTTGELAFSERETEIKKAIELAIKIS